MGEISADLKEIDENLFQLAKDIEILNFINPTNVETERQKFLKSRGKYTPQFKYKSNSTGLGSIKRSLNRIPIEKIKDDKIEHLYEQTIQSFCQRIDIILELGTNKFLDQNLRYFGEPQKRDVDNASFILYCPNEEKENGEHVGYLKAYEVFSEMVKDYGFDAEILVTKKIVSKAMVKNRKRQVLIKQGASFNSNTLFGTAHHEIGVHMVTTANSNLQRLKIFRTGLPLFTKTQEGLAIIAEYMSGYLSVDRIKELALRVMAIHKMINGDSFGKIFMYLREEGGLMENDAFYMATRIFRGGGCTKDHLYLKGFAELRRHQKAGNGLENLLIGKTSLRFLPIIEHMMSKGLIDKPLYITKVFKNATKPSDITDYIIKGLK